MASKYDAYWGDQLQRIRVELQLAATGVPAVVSLPDLVRLQAVATVYVPVYDRRRRRRSNYHDGAGGPWSGRPSGA
jgi:hypothetical protein